MKPVAIFQHTEVGAPGALPAVLEQLGVPSVVISLVDGAPVPASPSAYSGLVFMGGYMGVNDGLPWMEQEFQLIREADRQGIPVAGHCLGSQILAHALGAQVRRNPRREIGWQRIKVAAVPYAAEWFGGDAGAEIPVFQWHGDTFELPPGAVLLASSADCPHQVFVARDRHLGMQCHLEMTPALIELSVERNGHEIDRELAAGNPAVSSRAETLRDADNRSAAMHAVMKRLYQRWSRKLAR